MMDGVGCNGVHLICRRPGGKRHGGLWGFPGEKVHEGKDREQATRGELAEELDVDLTCKLLKGLGIRA